MYTRKFKYHKINKQSFFLFGPRGVGKTNWIEYVVKSKNQINLLDHRIFFELSTDPTQLETYILDSNDWVVIDEIQKIPILLDEVHRLIEKKKYKFILTGSSARKLKKMEANMLGGRALTENVFPLTVSELGTDFNFEKSLKIGHLPMAYNSEQPEKFLQSYVSTFIKEEVLQEGIVRNVLGFNRFLQVASFSQGQYLNVTQVGADCSVDRRVTENFFQILEDLLIATRLPHFKKKMSRKSDSHPKFFFFDVGVFRALRPKGPEDKPEFIDGAALETLVYQELRAVNSYDGLGYEFYCWKESDKIDVDLVLYGEKGILAFEIKRANRLRGGELNGLNAFKEKFSKAECFFLYTGSEERKVNDIHVLPIENFLINMNKYLK